MVFLRKDSGMGPLDIQILLRTTCAQENKKV